MSKENDLNRLNVKKDNLAKKITKKSLKYIDLLEKNDLDKIIQQNIAKEIVNLDIKMTRRTKEKILEYIEKITKEYLNNLKKSYKSLEYYFNHPDEVLNEKIKTDISNYLEGETVLDADQLSIITNSSLFAFDDLTEDKEKAQGFSEEISDLIEQLVVTNRKIRELEIDLRKAKEKDDWNKLIEGN